jgi:hypothetical protein
LNYEKTHDAYHVDEQLPVSSQRTFPAAPFPRKYIHCVIDELDHLVQAVHALRSVGFDARDIHVMACWDFVEAVERKYRWQSGLANALTRFLSVMDEDFSYAYLHQALQGKHFLAVRLSRHEQMHQVRELLRLHFAHLMKYIDTWTIADLVPPREQAAEQM